MTPFNPLDKANLGKSVGDAMLAEPVMPLGNLLPFKGAGVYALYYTGNFEAYARIAEENRVEFSTPIYVGKAVPAGGRKGIGVTDAAESGALYKRLKDHAESVHAAENLDLGDFFCRFLVVDEIWIPLGESLLIARFAPVWNALVDGFGNHNPGNGRYAQTRSKWDTLHPGRSWALKCVARQETQAQIVEEVKNFLSS